MLLRMKIFIIHLTLIIFAYSSCVQYLKIYNALVFKHGKGSPKEMHGKNCRENRLGEL